MKLDLLLKRVIFCLSILPAFLFSNPTGEQVVVGSASFQRADNALTVCSPQDKTVINWQEFSIASGELTRFEQASSYGAVLNRVIGDNLSAIYGSLESNGQVFLINQNGIVIGQNGSIKTNGFFASTHDIDDSVFMRDGKDKQMSFASDSDASVINEGLIECLQGDVFLIAREVQNKGDITAPNGEVGLEAGMEILIVNVKDNQHIAIKTVGDGSVSHKGNIQALNANLQAVGGNIYSMAINLDGNIEAIGDKEVGGEIVLTSEQGFISVDGSLKASLDDNGGTIHVLGQEITLGDNALLDVSAESNAGTILVGGGYQGADPDIFNASKTTVLEKANLLADSKESGNGGMIICWGEEFLSFAGSASAKGGKQLGDGGLIEISGKQEYYYHPTSIETLAYNGNYGQLLLDPSDLTIALSGTNDPDPPDFTVTYLPAAFANNTATLLVADLQSALANNNVAITTVSAGAGTGNITIETNITWASARTLTLTAVAGIIVNTGVDIRNTNNGGVNFAAITMTGGGSSTNGIILTGTGCLHTIYGDISLTGTVNGGTGQSGIHLDAGSSIVSTGVGTAAGNITLDGRATAGAASANGIRINNGSITTVGGDVQLTVTAGNFVSTGGDNIAITLDNGASISSTGIGTIDLSGESSTTGGNGIILTGTGCLHTIYGDISLTGTVNGGTGQSGIHLDAGSSIVSTGVGTAAGNITLDGRATAGAASANGIRINNGSITTVGGDVKLTVTAGNFVSTGGDNIAITIDNGASISSTGIGTIDLSGESSTTGGGASNGILIASGTGNTLITSVTAPIAITGTAGGTGSTTLNLGVVILHSATTISSTGGAAVNITGTGPSSTGASNEGVYINNATVTTVNGNLTIQGRSPATGGTNPGINILNGAVISSTGSGTVTVRTPISTTNSGTTDSPGVTITGSGTKVTSLNGAILIRGDTAATGTNARGILIDAGALIQSSGTALITITGNAPTGGVGGNGSVGVHIDGIVESTTGDINLDGIGGGTTGNTSCTGINIEGTGTFVRSLGAATLTMTGTAGPATGASNNYGVWIQTPAQVTTVNGDMTINGTGGSAATDNAKGIYMDGPVSTSGSGSITMVGTGGLVSNGSAGIYIINTDVTSSSTASDGGFIHLTGTATTSGTSSSGTVLVANDGKTHSIQSVIGNITLKGTGRGTSNAGAGVELTTSGGTPGIAEVRSYTSGGVGGSATILLDGDTNVATAGDGIFFTTGGSVYTQGTGSVTIRGRTLNTGQNDIQIDSGATLGNVSQTGDITLKMGSHTLPTANFTTTSGNIILQGYNPDETIQAGTGATGAVLNITNTQLLVFETGTVNPASIIIGPAAASAGTLTVRNFTLGRNYTFRHFDITSITSPIISGTYDVTMTSQRNINLITSTGITNTSGTITLTADSGTLTLASAIAAGSGALTLQAGLFDWTAGTAISGTNTLSLQPATSSTSIGLGGGSGTMNLSNTELDFLSDGFSSITIGQSSGTHAIEIGDGINPVSTTAFEDTLIIQGGSTINVNAASALGASNNSITLSGSTVNLKTNSNLNSGTGNVTINGNVIDLQANSDLMASTGTVAFNVTGSTNGTVTLSDTLTAAAFNITGGSLNDIFNVGVNSITATLDGGAGSNTLAGPSITGNTWNVTGSNAGTLATITFSNIQNLTGSATQDDDFTLVGNTAGISGILNGGSSTTDNSLTYQNWVPSALVNLAAGTGNGIGGGFINIDEVLGSILDAATAISAATGNFSEVITANQSVNNPSQLGTMEAVMSRDSGSQGLMESFGVLMNAASVTPLSIDDVGVISGGQMAREVEEDTAAL